MKFDQAFYTWGKNQLSRHREGLGICASSCMDSDFLDNCLAIGSRFVSERSEETSEFMIYEPKVRRYVGVAISPRADGGDGRVNFLGHFFIPQEMEENPDPSDYLLEYPFRREIEDGESVEVWDSGERKAYGSDFKAVRQTYELKGQKLAILLQTAWPCMFGEVSGINIVLGKERHREDLDLKAAREITWLLSMMAPGPAHVAAECRKNLSYGVRTKENRNVVRILYSIEPAESGPVFAMDQEESRQDILPVFLRMAELAERSVEEYRTFTDELLRIRRKGQFRCIQLPVLFLRWKLLHGEYVSKEDVADEINDILNSALSSQWESAFMEEYLLQAKDLGLQDINVLWSRFIIPMLKKYDGVPEMGIDRILDIAIRFLKMTWSLNREVYAILFSDLSDGCREEVARKLYGESDSIIRKQLEEISSCKELSEFLSLYGSLCQREEVQKKIFSISKQIYEEAQSQERAEITDLLLGTEAFREEWERWIQSRIEEARTIDGYLYFVERETGKMELRYAISYYCRLYNLVAGIGTEEPPSEEVDERVIGCEKKIRNLAGNRISNQEKQEFKNLIWMWESVRINRKIAGLSMEGLADYKIENLRFPECIKQWISCMVNKLQSGEYLPEDFYRKLLDKISTVYRWKETEMIGVPSYEKYLSAVWGSSNCEPRKCMLKRKMLFQIKDPSERFTIWSNVEIDEKFRDFQLLIDIIQENPELGTVLEDELEPERLKRVIYRIWKSVSGGEQIKERDLRLLNEQTCKNREEEVSDVLKQIQKMCRKGMTGGGEAQQWGYFLNGMALQRKRETINDRLSKSQKERCRKYRKLYEKEDAVLVFIKNEVCIGNLTDVWTECRVREIQTFLSVFEFRKAGKVSEKNIKTVTLLLKTCKEIFPEKIDEVVRLREERRRFMDECREEIRTLEAEKKEIEERLEKLYKIMEDGGEKIPRKREEEKINKCPTRPKEPLPACVENTENELELKQIYTRRENGYAIGKNFPEEKKETKAYDILHKKCNSNLY